MNLRQQSHTRLASLCALTVVMSLGVVIKPLTSAVAATTSPPPAFAFDSFDRTVATGLGSAPLGGTYTTTPTSPSSSTLNVQAGVANLSASTGQTVGFALPTTSVKLQEAALSFRVPTLPTTGGGLRLSLLLRQQADGSAVVVRVYVGPGTNDDTISICAPSCPAPGNLMTSTLSTDLSAGTDYTLRSRIAGSASTVTAQLSRSDDASNIATIQTAENAVTGAGSIAVQMYATTAGNVQISRLWAVRTGNEPFAYPNANNTGPVSPAGGYQAVSPNAVGRLSEDMIVIGTGAPKLWENKEFDGFVEVDAPDVVFRNCRFLGGTYKPNANAVHPVQPNEKLGLLNTGDGLTSQAPGGTVVINSEFVPAHNDVHINSGINGEHFTAIGVEVHDTLDGIKPITEDANVVNSWVHDMHYWATDPSQGGGPSHSDALQTWGTNGMVIAGNTLTNLGTGLQIDQSSFSIRDNFWVANFAASTQRPGTDGYPYEINFGDNPHGALVRGFSVLDSNFGPNDGASIIYVKAYVTFVAERNYYDDGTPITYTGVGN